MSKTKRRVPFEMVMNALDTGSAYYFVYLAFAPGPSGLVLVKVGISQRPLDRLVEINGYSPFPVQMAAFTPAGPKSRATRIEAAILARFQDGTTRGEWVALRDNPEDRSTFSSECLSIVRSVTRIPVTWARVNQKQIKERLDERIAATVGKLPKPVAFRRQKP